MFEQINSIAVIVSAILAVAVGSVWYSPLVFGPQWMRSMGKNVGDAEPARSVMIRSSVQAIIVYTLLFAVIAQFIDFGVTSGVSLLNLGCLILLLAAVHTYTLMLWEDRRFAYFLIHTGYNAIIIFGGIGVIAYWPW